jgi:hypothetical protein
MMFELNVKCRRMNEVSSNDTNLLYIHHTPSLPPLPSDSSTCLLRKKQARHPGMNPSLQVRSQSMRKHPIVSEPVTPVSPAYPPLHTHVPQKSRRTKEPQPPTPPHPRMESCPGQVLVSNRHGLNTFPLIGHRQTSLTSTRKILSERRQRKSLNDSTRLPRRAARGHS